MKKKELIIISSCACLAVVFIILGSLSPMIISDAIYSTVKEKAVLNEGNNPKL